MKIFYFGKRLEKNGRFLTKTWKIMRLFTVFFFVATLQISAKSYSQGVNLTASNITLKKAFRKIGNQTGYSFFINHDLLKNANTVSVSLKNVSVNEALQALLKNQQLTYAIIDKTVILKAKRETGESSSKSLLPEIQITGVVTDSATGEPLSGVTIKIKGSHTGTVTNADGSFSLNAKDGATLEVSYLGYASKTILVNGSTTFNISLSATATGLNQLVVVGYGTQKRSDITGAVASISADKIKNRPASNAMQTLAGQVPGMQIQQTQGAPGFAPTVQIRGINSISASNSPLYVIDGIPIEDGDLNMINPNDIASIEILKDASSSAIYGSRGANGVVIVTTKSGLSGKTRIGLSYSHSYQSVAHQVNLMNAQQFIQYYIDAHNNAWIDEGGKADDPNSVRPSQYRIPPGFISRPDTFRTTNWQDVLFNTAPMDNIQLSASGGDDHTTFLLSGGYLSQNGVVESSAYKRVTGRVKLDHKISAKVDLGVNVSVSGSIHHDYGTGGKSDVVSLALQNDPIFPVIDENGNWGGLRDPNSTWFKYNKYTLQLWHPYAITRARHNTERLQNLLAKAYINYKIINELTFKSSISATISNDRYHYFQDGDQKYGWSTILPAEGTSTTYLKQNWLFENTLNYHKVFKDHSVKALLGYTVQKNRYDANNLTSGNFPNDLVRTLNAGTVIEGGSSTSEWSLLSYIARLNYAYKNKYLATATIRRDGSSRFGYDTKWGYFPSVSVGWLLSEEDFMRKIKQISTLKLRASYGVVGNNFIPDYGAIGLLGQNRYVYGSDIVQGLYTSTKPNPDLQWEKTDQFDLGIELGLFNGRIYIESDYYKSTTKDLLLEVPVPAITGFTTQLTNIGKMQNQGVELSINTKNLINAFKWSSALNISFNKNKVLKLGPNDSPIYTEEWGTLKTEVGQPVSNFFGYIFDGVYNTKDQIKNSPHVASTEPGDPIVRDVNGDGVINSDDRTIIGNNQPKYLFGITNNFSYHRFSLSFLIQGSEGGDILNAQTRFSAFYNNNRNGYARASNYWRSPDDPGDGHTFKPSIDYSGLQTAFSTYWVEDGSYVRIKFIRLSYDFPHRLISKTFLSSADIYFNIENVYTFTKYTGYDPEASIFSSGLARGVDYGSYPLMRTVSFGVNLNF